MITQREFYGHAFYVSPSIAFLVNPRLARLFRVDPQTNPTYLVLTSAKWLRPGLTIQIDLVGTNTVVVLDYLLNPLAVVGAGTRITCGLVEGGTDAGVWVVTSRASGEAAKTVPTATGLLAGGSAEPTALRSYTVATNSWASLTAGSVARVHAAAFACGSRFFMAGGDPASSGADVQLAMWNGSAWAPRAALLTGMHKGCAVGLEGRGLAIGGEGRTAIESYDVTTDAWFPRAALGIARDRVAAVGCGRDAYLVGGLDTPSIRYDDLLDAHVTLKNEYTGVSRHSAGVMLNDGEVFIMGGQDAAGNVLDDVQSYEPTTRAWTTRNVLAMGARYEGAGFGIGQSGGYVGGRSSAAGAAVAEHRRYFNHTWSFAASALPVAGHSMLAHGGAVVP